MVIQHNISLKPFNTFGIDIQTRLFLEVNNVLELKKGIEGNNGEILILGGGSNILFTKKFDGLVLKNNIKGIEIVEEKQEFVKLKVGGGENWHEFVLYCINNNYAGLENLALIPGTVGACPMQNIGAYGVEVKDYIVHVEGLNLKTKQFEIFDKAKCEFAYRSSIFKTSLKGKYFITSVTFLLSKTPKINSSYGAINDELQLMKVQKPTIKNIFDAVIKIRTSKLPDPSKIGNVGSFFKNPVVSFQIKNNLLEKYPSMPYYLQMDGTFKLAAGWLIETCGWKGKRVGNCGVHEKQALVIVNYGGATGQQIFDLSEQIMKSVKNTFDIDIEREVNII